MTSIYLDESGYTGEDLMNLVQPAFVVASIGYSEDVCREFKNTIFDRVQADELKHARLVKSPRQRQMMVELLRAVGQHPELVKVVVYDKRFALTAKLVDLLIEPVLYSRQVDIYDKGGNIALANTLYLAIPAFAGEEYFNRLLTRFQRLVREETVESYESYNEFLLDQNRPLAIDNLLSLLRLADVYIGYKDLVDSWASFDALDLAPTAAFTLMSYWRQQVEDNITLIHDNSSAMAKVRDLWEAFVSPDVAAAEVGYDRRKIMFPIAVEETRLENSKDHVGLQFCDIVAGATARWVAHQFNPQQNSELAAYEDSLEEIIPQFLVNCMLPSAAVTPEELGTNGGNGIPTVDFLVDLLMKSTKRTTAS